MTKRDLGFIEGDLIECLNAGDGSWWMGRLRRDKRMVGLFPSNFVKLLDENFQPSRNASPLPLQSGGGGSISRGSTPNSVAAKPTPQKSTSMFRKPFQAYYAAGSPNPTAAAKSANGTSPGASPHGSVSKHKPYASMKRPTPEIQKPPDTPSALPAPVPRSRGSRKRSADGNHTPSPRPQASGFSQVRPISPAPLSRVPSPAPSTSSYIPYRAPSPAPPPKDCSYYRAASPASPVSQSSAQRSRAPSPAPPSQYHDHARAASPAPSADWRQLLRDPSPNPYELPEASPPPPPPPAHRVLYSQSRAPSPTRYDSQQDYIGRYHTPEPPPSSGKNYTPSPLTNAMNDVMSSLEDMTAARSPTPEPPRQPQSVWSPEAFEQVYTKEKKMRPRTSLGIGAQEEDPEDDVYNTDSGYQTQHDGPPQIHNYVQRMESRLRKMQQEGQSRPQTGSSQSSGEPPAPPPKHKSYQPRPQSSLEHASEIAGRTNSRKSLKNRKSAYDLGRQMLDRTFTTKTAQSTSTNTTQMTDHSLMSGYSAGAISATSAGSLARRKWGLGSIRDRPQSVTGNTRDAAGSRMGVGDGTSRPETPFTGVTYHSSHDSNQSRPDTSMSNWQPQSGGPGAGDGLGGFAVLKPKKSGFFKKMIESAKTGAASARSTIATGQVSRPTPHQKNSTSSIFPNGVTAIAGGTAAPRPDSIAPGSAARDMGLGGGNDWVQVRRDVNRSNSISRNERIERAERCQMLDVPVLNPVDLLYETAEGDEGLDGLPIADPTDFTACNLALVDKTARFVNSIPPMTTPASLAQGYVCRPYRSDVQRLRAIFTWVAERVSCEEDFEGEIDTRRVIQSRRGCAKEIAVLVMEMCAAVGIHCEVVHGLLKSPDEMLDIEMVARPNHYWNAVIVDGEWRIMDCALASPTNPKRSAYSSAGSSVAESWWFLARPMEICYTHVPLLPEQQHVVPSLSHDILMALPVACPPYFRNNMRIDEFDTSMLHMDDLEQAHVFLEVPEDMECVAEVEVRVFARDADGDFFESGEMVKKSALAQPDWVAGRKRYTVKALLPGDEGQGTLKVYAGKCGLRHSIKQNPHPLALSLALSHTGVNPPYDFLIRHPTPHAQRHDLYVAQPQCYRLAINNTFVFAVRQHPSSLSPTSASSSRTGDPSISYSDAAGRRSPMPTFAARPASAMSMASVSAAGSAASDPSNPSNASSVSSSAPHKPAKLAVQSPSGKIIRLVKRNEQIYGGAIGGGGEEGGTWETVVKIGERGTWRGLVLADRSARWCVFAEWLCV
ncbi:hypothetical protein H2201_007311 [Coniosporium apollinis]|uniref:SH3 domain-containing protein n=1 Tax=Coniosporium apollinis TaxID=61459 RepID=A0ABQ9NL85_9PEZI|nr:hypothetical protein H2201_007311 [Coniosporium apollinis]